MLILFDHGSLEITEHQRIGRNLTQRSVARGNQHIAAAAFTHIPPCGADKISVIEQSGVANNVLHL